MSLLNALSIAGEARKLIDGLHTSEAEKKALELEFEKLNSALVLARIDIAKTEAQHASIFVAGARPFGLWMSYGGIGAGTILPFLANAFGPLVAGIFGQPWQEVAYMPTEMVALLMTLGGFESGRRSFDKVKGVSRDSLKPKGG